MAHLQQLVAVQVSVYEVNIASVELRFHLGLRAFDVANQADDGIRRVVGELSKKLELSPCGECQNFLCEAW